MGNNQLLPFERNRYYVGKLLTSADFQAEQTYGNHKRRFLNEMMFGSGIICGLGVFSLDDVTVMVDSGVAMDGCGNEIAVATPIVRKLSAVDGFEKTVSNRLVLCLGYREEDIQPVYTVRGQESGENYECNRVREGWDLFLRDSDELPAITDPDCEFLAESVLYADSDYEFEFGKAIETLPGTDVTIISAGSPVYWSMMAAKKLKEEYGISARVIDMHTIKPLDVDMILKCARETGNIVTVEEHSINGGLGSAVAEVLLEHGFSGKFKRIGLPDEFAVLGDTDEIYKYYGMDPESIAKTTAALLGK